MNAMALREIKNFERDIKRAEKEPQSEGRDRQISFYRAQIKLWAEEEWRVG